MLAFVTELKRQATKQTGKTWTDLGESEEQTVGKGFYGT